ncbi:MAG: DUF1699 family protein [Euryarchaeota archaeon]|nr:DUF1699 family protein [Euryarchaeota archaeon]
MRLRIVSSRDEISELNANERMVHLAFRPSNVDLLSLLRRCPRLRVVQIPPSYHKTMSGAVRLFLEMQGVDLLKGDVWGHRKDIDEYFEVNEETVEEIESLISQGANLEDTTNTIQNKTRLGEDMIKYIARTKIAV